MTDADPGGEGGPDSDANREHQDTVELTAVVDRFEGDLAVLVLEAGDETVGQKVLPREQLPESARHQDAVLHVELVVTDVVDVEYQQSETVDRAESARDRFDRLSRRPPSDDSTE